MSTAQRILPATVVPGRFQAVMSVLANEALTLVGTLLQPGKVLAEVDQMSRLLVAANALDQRDPARAQMLRRRASAIGLN